MYKIVKANEPEHDPYVLGLPYLIHRPISVRFKQNLKRKRAAKTTSESVADYIKELRNQRNWVALEQHMITTA